MSTLKVSTISPLGTDATKTITVGASGDTFKLTDGITVSGAGANVPAFKAYISSGQTVATGTLTKITFQTELYDTNNAYDNSTNYRFTPQVSGKYFFLAKIRYEASGYTSNEIRIIKNGNTSDYTLPNAIFGTTSGTYYETYLMSGVLEANGSTDYFEIYSQQNSGGNASISASFGSTFEGYRLIGA